MSPLHRYGLQALTFVVLFTVLSGLTCHTGSPPGPAEYNKCPVERHTDWVAGELNVVQPALCPINILGASTVHFAESGRLPYRSVVAFVIEFYNADGQGVESNVQTGWFSFLRPERDSVWANGTYSAGTAGFSGSQRDRAFNELYLTDRRQTASAYITYQHPDDAQSLNISGPIEVMPYDDFTLTAEFHAPNAAPPLSYHWTRNGNFAGSSESVTWTAEYMGAVYEFVVTVTDGYGSNWSWSHTVYTKNCDTPGCADM